MGAASPPFSSYPRWRTRLRRAVIAVLALGPTALIVLMLLGLAPAILDLPEPGKRLTTFDLSPDPTPEPSRNATKAKPAGGRTRPAAKAPPVAPPTRPVETPAVQWPPEMIVMSRETIAATDKAMRAAPAPQQSAGRGDGSATGDADGDANDAGGVGRGPNGEKLFNAEWYRKPTDAELATYMPRSGRRSGWALIACRTAPDYRVEDCVELADSPPGSGLSRALRQAAWQFRVRPPRVGGKALVGAWVRIRFDFTVKDVTN